MVRSSYIIILSGMGDDVPILGAVVTLLKADGLLLYLVNIVIWLLWSSDQLVILSSGDLVIWSIWSSRHLVNMAIRSSGYLVKIVIWSIW